MEEEFKIGQLTKELVAMRIKKLEDPCGVAADMVKQAIVIALKARPIEAETVVSDACCGGLQGLYLSDHDLSRGAVLILQAVGEAADETMLDPTLLMSFALKGFARLNRLTTPEQLQAMREELERHFHGCGQAFADALAAQPDPSRRQTA